MGCIAQTKEYSVKTVVCQREELFNTANWNLCSFLVWETQSTEWESLPKIYIILKDLSLYEDCIAKWVSVLPVTLQQMNPSSQFLNCICAPIGTDSIFWMSKTFSNILMQNTFLSENSNCNLRQLNEIFWAWLKFFSNFFMFPAEFLVIHQSL